MANKKITELTALGAAPATNDLVPLVDISDTTDSANGTTKKMTVANLFNAPTLSDFTNANHDHTDADDGGQLTDAALSSAVGIAKGGTGQTTATAAFDALAPTTTVGDIIYHNGSDNIRLAKGTANQFLKMNDGATAPEWTNGSPFFQQSIPMEGQTGTNWQGSSSNQDGSVLIVNTSLTNELFRYERDSLTGQYLMTHNVSSTAASGFACVTVLGNYAYLFYDNNTEVGCYRYDLATLANETVMTCPTLDTSGANYSVGSYTDGTHVYVTQNKAGTVTNKWSVSGTTFSAVSTASTSGLDSAKANMYDGTSVYVAQTNSGTTFTYYKLTNNDGSAKTTLTKNLTVWSDTGGGSFLVPIDTTKMYIGRIENTYDEAAVVKGFIHLYPITKP